MHLSAIRNIPREFRNPGDGQDIQGIMVSDCQERLSDTLPGIRGGC